MSHIAQYCQDNCANLLICLAKKGGSNVCQELDMGLKLDTLRESAQMFEGDIHPTHWGISSSKTTGREFKGGLDQCRAFTRECWQKMCQMKAKFERSNVLV